MQRRLLYLVLGLYTAMILGIIVLANVGGTEAMFGFVTAIPHGDKLGHFGLIGVLAMLADLATGRHDLRLGRLHLPTAPLGLFVIVLGEEVSQLAITTRTFDLLDLSADVLGMVAFVSLGRWAAAKLAPCDEGRPEPRRS